MSGRLSGSTSRGCGRPSGTARSSRPALTACCASRATSSRRAGFSKACPGCSRSCGTPAMPMRTLCSGCSHLTTPCPGRLSRRCARTAAGRYVAAPSRWPGEPPHVSADPARCLRRLGLAGGAPRGPRLAESGSARDDAGASRVRLLRVGPICGVPAALDVRPAARHRSAAARGRTSRGAALLHRRPGGSDPHAGSRTPGPRLAGRRRGPRMTYTWLSLLGVAFAALLDLVLLRTFLLRRRAFWVAYAIVLLGQL